jgi:hypothetical protein
MQYEGHVAMSHDTLSSEEVFKSKLTEKVNPEQAWSGNKYRIVALERYRLEEVASALSDWAESNAQDEDFEDGQLKSTSFHEDETVSEFLASMFEVTRTQAWDVCVTLRVEARDKDEAMDLAGGAICGVDYDIESVDEA